jgi:Transposase DDE domain group 1
MSKCTPNFFEFPSFKNRKVLAQFNGGSVTSEGGLLLIKEIDRKLNLTTSIAKIFPDKRDPARIEHTILTMLRQRIYGIAAGYEDLNDHNYLRSDIAWQTAIGADKLASSPTLCRLENTAHRKLALDMHGIILEQFVASFKSPPEELILDFDATDDPVHGEQMGRFFHGYYGNYCFLPLYVFGGKQLLVAYLRPANQDGAKHAGVVLKLLVERLRKQWPNVRIILRGDSGFCRQTPLNWCERKNVKYIVGLARNNVLQKILAPSMEQAKQSFEATQEKQRIFIHFNYAAGSWSQEKKVIGKAEYSDQGENPRFIVTNIEGDPQALYEKLYCARGDMENRIKEQQLGLFADRTSCHDWWPNQLRVLLSAFAYILIERLRALILAGTELACAQVDTIRLKLIKIGAVVIRNTRRVVFMLSSHYPYQKLFYQVYEKLVPS